jgi:hypothetical protein
MLFKRELQRDLIISNMADELLTYCKNRYVMRTQLHSILPNCLYITNIQLSSQGCTYIAPRNSLNNHISTSCPEQEVKCNRVFLILLLNIIK